jgi:hypothetical protein
MDQKIPDNKTEATAYYREAFSLKSPELLSSRSGFALIRPASVFKMRFLGREVVMRYPDMQLVILTENRSTRPDIIIRCLVL